MKKLLIMLIGLMLTGWAASAGANDSSTEYRRVQVRGQRLVWVTPKESRPYALTGSASHKAATRSSHSRRIRGRAGYSSLPVR